MKYYISGVITILLILSGISFLFPVKEPSTSSKSGWTHTISRVTSPSPKSRTPSNTPAAANNTGQTTSKSKTDTSLVTPTETTVLGAKATPTIAVTSAPLPTATPTPIPLFLTLTSPTGDTEVSVDSITIIGKTVPNAEVFVNDQTVRANAVGIFTTRVQLEEGENLLSISANNVTGTYNEKEIVVTYNKP